MSGYQNDPGTVQQEAGFGFNGRYWNESYSDSLTATASGTQTNSIVCPSMFNRFSTVAAGAGCTLPPSTPGLTICVINAGANPLTVYPVNGSSDTINGVAAATGVVQMQNSVVYYSCITAGVWTAQGLGNGYGTGLGAQVPTYSSTDNITATPSGTQSTALLITTSVARIATVASSGDAVRLPPAQVGMEIVLINDAAVNPCNVFPASAAQGGVSGGDKINSGSQNAALSLTASNGAAGGPTLFFCVTQGTWRTK